MFKITVLVLWPTDYDRLTKISKYATIGGAMFAVVSLFFIYQSVQETEDQVKAIKELVDSSLRTVEILEDSKNEARHQSIKNSYEIGSPFDVSWSGCAHGEIQEADGTLHNYLTPIPLMVNEKGYKTTVPFHTFFDFNLYGIDEEGKKIILGQTRKTIHFDPENDVDSLELILDNFFLAAEERDFNRIQIDVDYEFRAYSTITGKSIGQQTDEVTKVLAIYELDKSGEWQLQDLRYEELICY